MAIANRVTSGTPTGGQFAAQQRDEVDLDAVDLTSQDDLQTASWTDQGIGPVRAGLWRERGKTPEEASDWETHGFDSTTSGPWDNEGFTPERAAFWQRNMFTADDARQWTEDGMAPPTESDEHTLADRFPDPQNLRPTVDERRDAVNAGLI